MTAPPPVERPTHVRFLMLALLMSTAAIAHFDRVSMSVAGNERIIKTEGISEQQIGAVYSAFLVVYTLLMLPGGWLLDRIGPRASLAWMGLGLGALVALTGALGSLGLTGMSLLFGLIVVRSIAGGTSVPLHPSLATSVSLWFPARSRSTANGLITAAALIGIALTYPVFGKLMDWVGWPVAFVVTGVVTVLFAVVWRAFAADTPAHHPWTNAAEQSLAAESVVEAPADADPDWLKLLVRNRPLLLLTLSYAALGYFQYLFFYWIGHYFSKELEWNADRSRMAGFIVTISMAAGMGVGGWLADRLCAVLGAAAGRRTMALCGMSGSAALALIGVLSTSDVAIITFFSLATASLGLCEGVFWTTATALVDRNRGLACALVNTGGNAGGAISPSLTPILAQFGWGFSIGTACLICLAGSVLWLWIGDPRQTARADEPLDAERFSTVKPVPQAPPGVR